MTTLVPKPLWSCLSQPIPGSTHAEHKATLGQALAERVKRMEGAVRQAHYWLWSNPLPWDPILWAHPSDPLNPFSVSHSAFSTSVPMPPRTRPTYQHPPPLPRHALKKPSKSGPTKPQPAIRGTPENFKRQSSHASAPPRAPPSSAIPRPTQHSLPRQPQKRLRSPQRNQTTITWAPPKRTKTARPLSPPRPRARYRGTRLPLTSSPTSTRCNASSVPPRHSASRDIRNFFRPSSELLSPPLDPFDPLPLPVPRPALQGNSAFVQPHHQSQHTLPLASRSRDVLYAPCGVHTLMRSSFGGRQPQNKLMRLRTLKKGSLPPRRLRFARVKPGAGALELGRTPSVYVSVISSVPLLTASSPRRPVSTGTPLVDVGRALTSSVFDLVLLIGTVLALSVTDIFTVQETSFSWCFSCSALVFQGLPLLPEKVFGLLTLVLVACICFRKPLLIFHDSK